MSRGARSLREPLSLRARSTVRSILLAVPSQLACPKCGAANPRDARSCSGCGTTFFVPEREWSADDRRDIARVKLGVLLVAAGLPLSWLLDLGSANDFLAYSMGDGVRPLGLLGWGLGGAGVALLLAGAVLVFVGRRPFEYSLGGKALVALLLILLSVGIELFALRFLFDGLTEFVASGDPAGIAWMYKSVLLWSFLFPAIGVLGVFLLVFDLLNERGLRLAFLGVVVFAVAGVSTLVVGWVPIDLAVGPVGTPAFDFDALHRILGPALIPLWVAGLAWRALFVIVYLRTRRRIARWEIPVPPEAHGPSSAPRPS